MEISMTARMGGGKGRDAVSMAASYDTRVPDSPAGEMAMLYRMMTAGGARRDHLIYERECRERV